MGTITAIRKAVRQAIQPNRELSAAEFFARRAQSSYEDPELIRFRVERAKQHAKAESFLSAASPGFLTLLSAASMAAPAHVIDFGGAFGHYGEMLKAALPAEAFWAYSVFELPAFTDAAEAAGFRNFVRDPKDANPNVVFSSGTLQYMPNPLVSLDEMLSLNADYVVLARNFFSASGPRYFEQKSWMFEHGDGPIPSGFENRTMPIYPQALPYGEVVRMIEQHYQIIASVTNNDGVPYESEGLFGIDLICRRRD